MSRRIVHTPALKGGSKPKVLLVDDHPQVLHAVSAMLSPDFDVVGTVPDGNRALEEAVRLQPDVIVMDVEMPGIDGFATLRMFRRTGLATPVVFLSMHEAEDIVGEAFRCGGRGYVLKPRLARDLVTAVDQALHGRSFVPSLATLVSAEGGNHALHLFHSRESYVDGLADFFDAALRRGDATCVFGPESLRQNIGARLEARGWNISGIAGHKRYVGVDAASALREFMRDGAPDPDRLATVVKELDDYRRTEGEGLTPRLTVGGSMSALLADAGNTPGATALENLWDELTRDLPFLTVCGYASSCFDEGAPDMWPAACGGHRVVSHARDI